MVQSSPVESQYNDSGVFMHSSVGHALEAGEMNLPSSDPLEGWQDDLLPYFLVDLL